MDYKLVTAAVKIKIQMDRNAAKRQRFINEGRHSQADRLYGKVVTLQKDLIRLKEGMTPEELTHYNRRVA